MLRRPQGPVEATQELQALDIVEIEALVPKAAEGVPAPRRRVPSNSSIAPVGLDLASARGKGDDEANATMQVRVPLRRRRLRGIVIGAVAGCLVILLAAGIARIANAGHEPDATARATPAATTPATTAAATPSPATAVAAATAAATTTPAPATTGKGGVGGAGDVPSTGTVRLDRPAVAGRVWLDGKKLTSSSALVSCGTHQIKVGFKRAHSIDVPCGGEIGVSK